MPLKFLTPHTGEIPPEQITHHPDPFPVMILAQRAWRGEPVIVQARRDHPDCAIYLYCTQARQYLFIVMSSVEFARDYAERYELMVVAAYQGGVWRGVPGLRL